MSRKSTRRSHRGGPPGGVDPYLQDRNIRDAASLQLVGMTALGAGTGFGAAGWFGISTELGTGVGAAIAFVAGSVFLSYYGGRQTR